jgi:hypothetical protein
MARGDVKWFASFIQKSKDGVGFDLAGDAIKMGIVGNGVAPTVSTADPRWGSGGTTDFSVQQVGTGTAYTGPITLANVTYARSSGVTTLDADNVTVAQDAAGFTTGYWGILYDDTVAGKYAIGFVDLGGPVSIQGGPLNINWNASGILQETAS